VNKFFERRGPIRGVEALLDQIKALGRGQYLGPVYLRGQRDSGYGLRPSIGRKHSFGGKVIDRFTEEQERNLLHRFRRYAYLHCRRDIGPWEALILARHHGLPVRLLDWTPNPLVALYWACADDNNTEGAIWAFRQREDAEEIDIFDPQLKSPMEVHGVKIIQPFHASIRMTVQSSIFTIQHNPWKNLEEYAPDDYRKKDFDIEELAVWPVPAECKTGILENLEKVGINQRTLFPDLSGIASGLWQTEVLRSGKGK